MLVGDRREQLGAVGHSRYGLAQRGGELIEHAGVQHEADQLRRERGKLLAEIVRQDRRGRGQDAPRQPGRAAARVDQDTQADRPPLGCGIKLAHFLDFCGSAAQAADQSFRLVEIEAQSEPVEPVHTAACLQGCNRQRRSAARDENCVKRRRCAQQQRSDAIVQDACAEEVHVIEEQVDVVIGIAQGCREDADRRIDRDECGAGERVERRRCSRQRAGDRFSEAGDELVGLVILRRECHPADGRAPLGEAPRPVGGDRGLSEPVGGSNDDQAARRSVIQCCDQPRTGDQPGRQLRQCAAEARRDGSGPRSSHPGTPASRRSHAPAHKLHGRTLDHHVR